MLRGGGVREAAKAVMLLEFGIMARPEDVWQADVERVACAA